MATQNIAKDTLPNPRALLARAMLPSPRRRRARRLADVDLPATFPAGSIVAVPGRGEMFLRDSGGQGPPVLLLHGWMVSADLNWFLAYQPLIEAGYRVLAIDHRGHGRGIRAHSPFRLLDCALDAAALIETLDCGPVIAAGYSMGGPITQLLARERPELLSGIVLCATSREWQAAEFRRVWSTMWLLRIVLALSSGGFWSTMLSASGVPETPTTAWMTAELQRGAVRDIAEAGRELGRFDSRPWLGSLRVPAAVVITSRDRSVPPRLQRELAAQLNAAVFDLPADHMAAGEDDGRFPAVLLEALSQLRER